MNEPVAPGSRPARQASAATVIGTLLYANFPFFMSRLVDPAGQRLVVAAHHRRWAHLITQSPRLVLLAPRDHGKSTLTLAYVLWQFYRHGHDAAGRALAQPAGVFSAVLFSAGWDQASSLFERFRDLLLANEALIGGIGTGSTTDGRRRQVRWSRSGVRLPSGAELSIRAFRTSTRGLHPDLLLLDDVLNDENSASSEQRRRTWRYFQGTLRPMNPRQLVVIGTAFHQLDLLHRLRTLSIATRGRSDAGRTGSPPPLSTQLRWYKFRALEAATERALWPERHPVAELLELRAQDPAVFSREYQNDPRDDLASMFPHALTQPALDAGAEFVFAAQHRPSPDETVVMGIDLAISGAAGADFTVAIVVALNTTTGRRHVLTIRRTKGLDLTAQIDLLADLFARYAIEFAVIESNGFQEVYVEELRKRPESHGRVFPHVTGRNKADRSHGIPRLVFEFQAGSWVMHCGDAVSLDLAQIWQDELSRFGWRDGRLESTGEHDDCAIATWLVEVAIGIARQWVTEAPQEEIIFAEDLGFVPVSIGPPYA